MLHRRRKIRPPAAKDRALRGALGKGPPRARLLPELKSCSLPECARCPENGTTCHAYPAESRPVSLNQPHLEHLRLKQIVFELGVGTLRANNWALSCLQSKKFTPGER